MSNKLSSQSEKIVPYQLFGPGRETDLMPELKKAGYRPSGIALIAERRETAPDDVRINWKDSFLTGDSSSSNKKGGIYLRLDCPIVQELTPEDVGKLLVKKGALPLTRAQKTDIRNDKEHTVYLSPKEVEEADGKGYVKQNGVFVPANKVVAKAWDHLLRGRAVQPYAQMVSEESENDDIMRLYFDRTNPNTLRSLFIDSTDVNSSVVDHNTLNVLSCLAGVHKNVHIFDAENPSDFRVAPEAHVALEARVAQAIKGGRPF